MFSSPPYRPQFHTQMVGASRPSGRNVKFHCFDSSRLRRWPGTGRSLFPDEDQSHGRSGPELAGPSGHARGGE